MFGGDVLTATGGGPGDGDRLARAASRLDDAGVALLADLAETLVADPTSLTCTELLAGAIAVDRVRSCFDAATHRLHAVFDDAQAFAIDGARSGSAWLNAHTCVSSKAAGIGLSLSRKLRGGFPVVGESFAAGRIGEVKVRLLVKARKPDVEAYFDWMEPMLVAEVESRTVEAATLFLLSWRYRLLELLAQNDPDVDPDPHGEGSRLHLSKILDGRLVLDGELDAEDAAILAGAIEAKVDSWFQAGLLGGDPRTRAELQAAALVELVRDGADPSRRGGSLRPMVLAVADVDTLAERARRAHRARTRVKGRQPDDRDADRAEPSGTEPAGLVGGTGTRARGGRSRRGPANRPRRRGPAARPGPRPDPATRSAPPGGSGPPNRAGPPHGSGSADGSGSRNRSGAEEGRSGVGGHFDPSDLDDLARRLGLHPRVPSPPDGPEPRMAYRSEIVGSGPVPPAVIERLMCTADICRVVHRGASEILDVGRTHRLATAAQRRALVVRSGGSCEWPGCSIPHTWCDAHHLQPWEQEGLTDLDNLAQVCRHHHRQFHDNDYIGLVESDGLHVYRPDGTEITTLLSQRT